ncbi:Uncharacterised protein [Bordetella pertussis]|nr:Uncharacterised protein [Bordetella pertussis]
MPARCAGRWAASTTAATPWRRWRRPGTRAWRRPKASRRCRALAASSAAWNCAARSTAYASTTISRTIPPPSPPPSRGCAGR